MSLSDNKKEVFGRIAALRATTKGYLTKTKNSAQSINNSKDSVAFLIDLLKSLEDFNEMKQVIIDMIVLKSKDIEADFKSILKKELKKISLCTANPSVPTWVTNSGPGFDVKIKELDLYDIFKEQPNSDVGKLLFNDYNSGINSTDFNTFLSATISNNGLINSWGTSSPIGQDIFDIKFNQFGASNFNNNSINIKVSSNYANQKLSKLNDDYIDSLELLSTEKLISALLDSFSGVISFQSKKSKDQIKREEEVNTIIDSLINSDETDVIDDSFFEFSNTDNINIDEIAERKVKGVFILETSERKVETSLDFDSVVTMHDDIESQIFDSGKADILNKSLEALGGLDSLNIPPIDMPVVKLNFIENIVKNLTKIFVNLIISPKVMMIFLLNQKIVGGDSFSTIKDFIKNNNILFKMLINTIKSIIIKIILTRVLNQLEALVQSKITEIATERLKNRTTQMLSLFGSQINIDDFL